MARTRPYIKGSSVDEKLASVERTLQHFSRRLQKTVVVQAPPGVVCGSFRGLPATGTEMFRMMFPASGTLEAALVRVSGAAKPFGLNIMIRPASESQSSRLFTRKIKDGVTKMAGDIRVEPGEILVADIGDVPPDLTSEITVDFACCFYADRAAQTGEVNLDEVLVDDAE